MLFKADRIVVEIFKALAFSLPLSLIEKLADRKLTREELQSLIREVTVIVAEVLVKVYNENNESEDKADVSEVVEEDI